MILSFYNQKGGSGKTTLSINTATALGMAGLRTLLVDADPQGSATRCREERDKVQPDAPSYFTLTGGATPALHKEIQGLARGFDYVVIDGVPRNTDLSRSIALASDVIFIPVTPSPFDVWATEEGLDLIEQALMYKPGLRMAFVLTRKIAGTRIEREVRDALQKSDIPLLQSEVTERTVFAYSAKDGLTVFESRDADEACAEINALKHEILKWK